MIDLQLLNSALMALMITAGLAVALSAAMMLAGTVSRPGRAPGQPPRGGTRRDVPLDPAPEHDARELVLL